MAKIKNNFGEDRNVPGLGGRLVLAGAVIDVPDAEVYSYTCQGSDDECWVPVDRAAVKAHEAGVKSANPNPEPDAAPDPTEG